MPSEMLAMALADPEYHKSLDTQGFKVTDRIEYGGRQYNHNEIAEVMEDSYKRHRPEFAIMRGGKPRIQKQRERQFEKAVKADAYTFFGLSWWTIAFGVIVFWLSGPLGLVIAVITCYFMYLLRKDISDDPKMMMALGCA